MEAAYGCHDNGTPNAMSCVFGNCSETESEKKNTEKRHVQLAATPLKGERLINFKEQTFVKRDVILEANGFHPSNA